ATVLVGYHRNPEGAAQVAAELAGTGHMPLRVSNGDSASIAEAAGDVSRRFGRLDILVNNGGATTPVPVADFEALTDDIFDEIVRVNLRGPFAVVRAFRSLLETPDRAVIVNVSSIAARTGVGSNLAYCAAKGGLDTLTIALAKLLGPKIRVLGVAPAGVDTDFVAGRSREKLMQTARSFPLAHLTTADDVARSILACICDLTSTTGVVVPVDEGRHL
ncbi:MAG: SDR family oxidoreductase, partial [Pseudolabrys sp.]